MFRNLKNKNVLMILLLLLILVSVFSYNMIQTTVEGFISEDLVNYFEYVSTNGSFKFYKLKEAGISSTDLATIRSNYNAALLVAANVADSNPPPTPTWCTNGNLDPHCFATISVSPSQWEAGEVFDLTVRVGKEFMAAEPGPSMIRLLFSAPSSVDLQLAADVVYEDGHKVNLTSGLLFATMQPTTTPLPTPFARLTTGVAMNESTLLGYLDCQSISNNGVPLSLALLAMVGGGEQIFRLACYPEPPPAIARKKDVNTAEQAIAALDYPPSESFTNLFSNLFLREGLENNDIIIGISNEELTKVYDLEGNHLSTFSLTISGENIINNGIIVEKVADIITTATTPTTVTTPASLNTGMTNAQILTFAEAMKDGDTDIILPERDRTYSRSSMKNVVLDYLLGNSGVSFQESGYYAPHYNSFESAMSTPSNPIVNPVNSMNPLDYSQSLFGPNVTPTMMQNMCKNSNTNNFSDFKNGNDSEAEDGDKDGATNEANNGSNNGSTNGSGANNGSTNGSELQQPQTYSTSNMNMDSNTCQNCNGKQNSNNTCSSCENKNSILNGGGYSPHLPRPVLTNFSNFGN